MGILIKFRRLGLITNYELPWSNARMKISEYTKHDTIARFLCRSRINDISIHNI